jgi:hypothetical protein
VAMTGSLKKSLGKNSKFYFSNPMLIASIIGKPQPSPLVGKTKQSKLLYNFGISAEGSSSEII